MIDFHTHNNKTAEGITTIRSFSIHESPINIANNQQFSIGLHPWNIEEVQPHWQEDIINYIKLPNCIMIGECGLDNLRSNLDKQKEVFCTHIKLSEEYQKPLIIHSVHTHHIILQLHSQHKPSQPWHIHGYTGSTQMALELLSHGIGLSFGQQLLFSSKLQQTYLDVEKYCQQSQSLQMIHFETDNKPISVAEIYEFAKQLQK